MVKGKKWRRGLGKKLKRKGSYSCIGRDVGKEEGLQWKGKGMRWRRWREYRERSGGKGVRGGGNRGRGTDGKSGKLNRRENMIGKEGGKRNF